MTGIAMPITALYGGMLVLLSVFVANRVLKARLNAKDYPEWKEETNLRIQGNFVENTPLALVMLLALELGGLPDAWIHWMGGFLVLFRVLHAWGMSYNPGATYPRLIGAQGTFVMMSVMGMSGIYFFLF